MWNFGWWRDKDNREGAKSIVDVLKVVIPALVISGGAVWGVLYATDKKPPDGTSITVSTGANSPVTIGEGNTQNVTND